MSRALVYRFALGLAIAACSDAASTEITNPNPLPSAVASPAAPGEAAPDFTLRSLEGQTFTLGQQRGKIVVLEWTNPDCPFVKHAYEEQSAVDLSKRWSQAGVVWWVINSNRPGAQGSGLDRNKRAREDWGHTGTFFLDETGAVGKAYGAKTTPQMVVVDATGKVAYIGALHDAPMEKGRAPRQYTDEVLSALSSGGPVPFSRQQSWGCSVKY